MTSDQHDDDLCAAGDAVQGRRGSVLGALCVGYFLSCSAIIVFSVSPTFYERLLSASGWRSSLLSASPMISVALLSLPASAAARQWGSRWLISAAALCSAAALLLTAALLHSTTDDNAAALYPTFVAIGVLAGLGAAAIPAGVLSVSWWWPEHRQGLAIGTLLFATALGPVVFGPLAELIERAAPLLYLLWGALTLLGAAVVLLFGHDPPYVQIAGQLRRRAVVVEPLPGLARRHDSAAGSDVSQQQLRQLCAERFQQAVFPSHALVVDLLSSARLLNSWCLFGIASATLGCFLGLVIWLPSFFVGAFAASGASAGTVLMGYSSAGAVCCLLAGWAADHSNVWLASSASLLVACLSYVALVVSTSWHLSVAAALLSAAAAITANTYCFKMVIDLCPACCAGTIGWMETGGNAIGLLLPLVWGAVADANQPASYRTGMIVPAAFLAVALLLLLVLYINVKCSDRQQSIIDSSIDPLIISSTSIDSIDSTIDSTSNDSIDSTLIHSASIDSTSIHSIHSTSIESIDRLVITREDI